MNDTPPSVHVATGERTPRSFAFGPFTLIPERQLLVKDTSPVRIGGRALDILTVLVERPGEIVNKRELLARVWPDTFVEEGNLKVNMLALRRALGDEPGKMQYVATVTGRGYRFVAPVQTDEACRPTLFAAMSGRDLPTLPTRIFGRAAAIDAIRRDLAASKLVSIVGAGGVGKTTVAIAAASGCADAVVFVDLAKISEARLIPAAIGSALGLSMAGADPIAAVSSTLKLRPTVLLLDTCEHLMPAVAAVADGIARQCPGVCILATSREPLRIRDERVHRLEGLECEPRAPAVELFARQAFERSEYQLTDSDAPAVSEICRRLDGNPLAIEFAATHTDAFSPTRILRVLDDRLRLFKLGPHSAPLRQQSLLATLDWSYRLLSERQTALLRAVCVFAGIFSADAAAAVSNTDNAEVLDTLAQLAAKSLLAVDTTSNALVCRMPETTRIYGLERLRASGEHQIVRRRHEEYVSAVLTRRHGLDVSLLGHRRLSDR